MIVMSWNERSEGGPVEADLSGKRVSAVHHLAVIAGG